MNVKLGIPRGMLYFDYHILWQEFFNNLGVEVLISPKTNKDILDRGIKSCVDEACLPVKVFHGHVDYLKDKVDYIFIPKFISIYKREYCCPKHLGLPDMVKHSIKTLPQIIDTEINLRKSDKNVKRIVQDIGKNFEKRPTKIYAAFKDAYEKYNRYNSIITSGVIPLNVVGRYDDLSFIKNIKTKNYGRKILLLGHTYNIYDQYINMDVVSKLKKSKFDVITTEMIEEQTCRNFASDLSKRMFWTHGQRIIGAAFSLIEERSIYGIIYVSAFGCGLDSVLIDLIERKAKEKRIPFTLLTIDEQTGEAGINTRIEAFIDMLEWRNNNEDNISTYG